jgi:hypothetical protein
MTESLCDLITKVMANNDDNDLPDSPAVNSFIQARTGNTVTVNSRMRCILPAEARQNSVEKPGCYSLLSSKPSASQLSIEAIPAF